MEILHHEEEEAARKQNNGKHTAAVFSTHPMPVAQCSFPKHDEQYLGQVGPAPRLRYHASTRAEYLGQVGTLL